MFSSKPKTPSLHKQLTMEEKIEQRKESMRLWAFKNFPYLIIALTVLGMITFLLTCILFIHGTDSGAYYNWGMK